MAQNSASEWTETTWNPLVGCSHQSPGCGRCYGVPMANRLAAMGQTKYQGTTAKVNGRLAWTGRINLDERALKLPARWTTPKRIFVNSMGDIFHPDVPIPFILRIFAAMQDAPHHIYQILTKRSERVAQLDRLIPWIPSVWLGVTVETAEYGFRIGQLRRTGAAVKFLSLEPLLGPIPNINLQGIDWVIVGGESGPGARPMRPEWVRDVRDQCLAAKVPFFFKQWGGRNRKAAGRRLDGRAWDELPPLPSSPAGRGADAAPEPIGA